MMRAIWRVKQDDIKLKNKDEQEAQWEIRSELRGLTTIIALFRNFCSFLFIHFSAFIVVAVVFTITMVFSRFSYLFSVFLCEMKKNVI